MYSLIETEFKVGDNSILTFTSPQLLEELLPDYHPLTEDQIIKLNYVEFSRSLASNHPLKLARILNRTSKKLPINFLHAHGHSSKSHWNYTITEHHNLSITSLINKSVGPWAILCCNEGSFEISDKNTITKDPIIYPTEELSLLDVATQPRAMTIYNPNGENLDTEQAKGLLMSYLDDLLNFHISNFKETIIIKSNNMTAIYYNLLKNKIIRTDAPWNEK